MFSNRLFSWFFPPAHTERVRPARRGQFHDNVRQFLCGVFLVIETLRSWRSLIIVVVMLFPGTKMGIINQLAKLIVNGDPKNASILLEWRYPDDDCKAYATWCAVRSRMVHDETNRNPEYLPRLNDLISSLPEDHPDRGFLGRLVNATLRVQHKVFVFPQRKPLVDDNVSKIFFSNPPVIPALYEFEFPKSRRENANAIKVQAREDRHLHLREDDYIDQATIDMVMGNARSYVASKFRIIIQDHYIALASALALLSGRRFMEIVDSLQWKPNGHEYQASVTGLKKGDYMDMDQPRWVDIPLLIPYREFDDAMRYLRSSKDRRGRLIGPHLAKRSGIVCVKGYKLVFGDFKMTHTISRSLYLKEGFRRRFDENHFHTEMSELMWNHHALAHMDKLGLGVNVHYYTRMVIRET